jgi:hypothetical protein
VIGADRTVGVTFAPTPTSFTLTVVVAGPADSLGRVFALQPPGTIDCGVAGGVCTVTVAPGTPVLLRPDDSSLEQNLFAGWSG